MDRQRTDDRRSEKLTWPLSSGELKTIFPCTDLRSWEHKNKNHFLLFENWMVLHLNSILHDALWQDWLKLTQWLWANLIKIGPSKIVNICAWLLEILFSRTTGPVVLENKMSKSCAHIFTILLSTPPEKGRGLSFRKAPTLK